MRHFSWQVALTNAIAVSAIGLGTTSAVAQSRPIADDTLGRESSTVVPLDPNGQIDPPRATAQSDRIDGGARRGDNLFHSFREFHVDAGRSVYFADPGVDNILARVTGGIESQILGTLGVLGDANLFLLNPSGIIFGSDARLDLRGSFVATTADGIEFGEQGFFSATDPTAPPLLTVQPTAALFTQLNPAPIANRSIAPVAEFRSGLQEFGLRVPDGESLTLLGGDIRMDGGGLTALGGRIAIGGLSEPGTVRLNANGSLSFPIGVARSNVSLTNGSRLNAIDVTTSGGSITVNARALEIANSFLLAGTGDDSRFVNVRAGDITLNASDIRATSAAIENVVRGSGNGGDVRITTDSLSLTNSSFVQATLLGQGAGGNVIINASDRTHFDNSVILSVVDLGAVGSGGNIEITTPSLSLTNGGQLVASTLGQGNAGSITIDARDRVSLAGTNSEDFPSAIFSTAGDGNAVTGAAGNSGNIRITTGSLSLTNGANLDVSTFERGNAGDVILNVRDRITLDASDVFTSVSTEGVGTGGNIRISADSLLLTNRAELSSSTFGRGDAGDVTLNVRRITLNDGNVFTSVAPGGVGTSGNIRIRADSLTLLQGAELSSSTFGQGDAGDVTLNVRRITLNDGNVFTDINPDGVGAGGDIRISADSLRLLRGAELSSSTFGRGDAGDVWINVRDRITLDDGNVFTSVTSEGVGTGGDIHIRADSLLLTNRAALSSSTAGRGDAGNVWINVRDRVSLEETRRAGSQTFQSGISTSTGADARGLGGDVTIAADSIRIADSAVISTETANRFFGGTVTFNVNTFEATAGGQVVTATSGEGRAGNIIVNADDRITLSGVNPFDINANQGTASGLFASTARNSTGNGGRVRLSTGQLQVFDRARISVSSRGAGIAGNIRVVAADVRLNDQARLIAETTASNGGNIRLRDVEFLQISNNSLISTTAGTDRAGGNGGNIDIDADLIVALPNDNSDIRANAFTGSGGTVDITTQGLFGIAAAPQDNRFTSDITASSRQGVQGTVDITTPDVDPRRGLTELPVEVVDASSQITQTCGGTEAGTSEFVVTGRGGVPTSPIDPLVGDQSLADWSTLDAPETAAIALPNQSSQAEPASIVEAQGWVVAEDGTVRLIATAPVHAAQPPEACHRAEN